MQTATQQYVPPGGTGEPGSPGSPPPASSAVAQPAKARTALIALAAIVTELIVIAAVGNQWVADKLVPGQSTGSLASGVRYSALTYAWRFTPRRADAYHQYAGSWTIVGTTVVLSALLIVAVVRGPITFGRAFFGAWMAVPVATMLGGYGRAFVIDIPLRPGESRASRALFGTLAPGSGVFVAGFALGLLVAIAVGFVAVVTRRRAVVATPAADDYGDGNYAGEGMDAEPPQWQDRYYGPPPQTYGGAAERPGETTGRGETAELPSLRKDDTGSTSRLPDVGEPGPRDVESGRGDDSTAVFARQPQRDPNSADTSDIPASDRSDTTPEHANETTTQFPGSREPAEDAPARESTEDAPAQESTEDAPAQESTEDAHRPESAEDAPAAEPGEDAHAAEPDAGAPAPESTDEPESTAHQDEQSTMNFPRPPDDEDIHPER